MILQTLTFQPEKLISLCAVCISDRNGGQIALTYYYFIVSSFRCSKLGVEEIFFK